MLLGLLFNMRSSSKCWSLFEKDPSQLSMQPLICCQPPASMSALGSPQPPSLCVGWGGGQQLTLNASVGCGSRGLGDQQFWGINVRTESVLMWSV